MIYLMRLGLCFNFTKKEGETLGGYAINWDISLFDCFMYDNKKR